MGRTARGEGGSGKALLLLQPQELGFLMYLRRAKVQLNEFEFSWAKVANIQSQVGAFEVVAVVHACCVSVLPKMSTSLEDVPNAFFFSCLISKKVFYH